MRFCLQVALYVSGFLALNRQHVAGYEIGATCSSNSFCDFYITMLGQDPYSYDGSAFCNHDTNQCECAAGTYQVDGTITCCPTTSPCVGGNSGHPSYTTDAKCDTEYYILRVAAGHSSVNVDNHCDMLIQDTGDQTRKILSSEGEDVTAEVAMTLLDAQSKDVTFDHVINTGEKVKVQIMIVEGGGMFTSLRAEVCVVSDMLSLEHPSAQSTLMLLHGCPVYGGLFSSIIFIFTDSLTIESSPFPAAKLGDSAYLFVHCAVRLCKDDDECHLQDCSRKRLSSSLPAADALKGLSRPDYKHQVLMMQLQHPEQMSNLSDEKLEDERDLNSLIVAGIADYKRTPTNKQDLTNILWVLISAVVYLVTMLVIVSIIFVCRTKQGSKDIV